MPFFSLVCSAAGETTKSSSARTASAWVDVTETLEIKVAALREHVSQLRHPEELEERIRTWAREEGERVGVEAAESFRVIELG